jgi:hypothetical protein
VYAIHRKQPMTTFERTTIKSQKSSLILNAP